MSKNWKEAVWQAVLRQSQLAPEVSRQRLMEVELERIIAEVGSKGATPHQTLSRVLQDLRNDGVLIFDGRGSYRISNTDLSTVDAETAARTESVRLQTTRLGQSSFRKKLERRWNGTCPLTGISDRNLLRASHVIPWNRCETSSERLSVENGLLLSALWDAAFDRGLVTFDEYGVAMFADRLDKMAEAALRQSKNLSLNFMTEPLSQRIETHRKMHANLEHRRAL